MPKNPVMLSAYTLTTCAGRGVNATRAALRAGASALAPCRFETVSLDTFVGEIEGVDDERLPAQLRRYDCRNNRAAELALAQDGFLDAVESAARRHGRKRIAVLIGTSTAGILQTEQAYRRRDPASGALPGDFEYRGTHNTFSVAEYVRERLGLEGPCAAVSTACSSSAKVFASASRLIGAGVIDAAVVGGVDTLCLTTLYGFNSLQLLSAQPCRPYDATRDGISIGEGAAFALVERAPAAPAPDAIWLLGAGESSDAHHMSAPHPEGRGAFIAMQAALRAAALQTGDIDYVNLHGTATPSNDSAEDRAVHALFADAVPVNSTKGLTGHTLGAAGAVEAVISALCIDEGFVPASPGTRSLDPALRSSYQIAGLPRPVERVLSNSFGFGGSNCSLVIGRRREAA